jgi:hypothetical protein
LQNDALAVPIEATAIVQAERAMSLKADTPNAFRPFWGRVVEIPPVPPEMLPIGSLI